MVRYGYIELVLIGTGQLFNAICGGKPDETLAARCWRKRAVHPWNIFRIIIDCIFFWHKDYCRFAWYSEMQRIKPYQHNGS